MNQLNLERRRFLKLGAMSTAAVLFPGSVFAAINHLQSPKRKLSFYNTHTGENLNVCYYIQGKYCPDALDEINHLLRDHRTNEIKPIDTRLLNLLFAISKQVEKRSPIHIVSGYRSPETNAMLRKRSKKVARKSMHMQGKAIDIRWPGCDLNHLRRIAIALKGGGVGYYPRSNFVHVDTGEVRYW